MNKHLISITIFGLATLSFAGDKSASSAEVGRPAERHLSEDQTFTRWALDPEILDDHVNRGSVLCTALQRPAGA